MERTDLIARESIRDLMARYTWAGDRGDLDALAECFADDGVLDVGDHGGRWVGRAEIVRQLQGVVDRLGATSRGPLRHHVSSVVIDLDLHDAATARSYFLVMGPDGPDHWGRYRDRVVETMAGGRWVFAERVVRVDGRASTSIAVPDGPA